MDLLILIIALVITFTTGSIIEKNHFKKIKAREKALLKQPLVSFDKHSYSSKQPIKKIEMVTGEVVISGDYFKSFVSAFRNLIGGRMVSYESLMERARREAILRMREKARGANIIVNTKIESMMINNPNDAQNTLPQVAVIAYGTAISYGK